MCVEEGGPRVAVGMGVVTLVVAGCGCEAPGVAHAGQ